MAFHNHSFLFVGTLTPFCFISHASSMQDMVVSLAVQRRTLSSARKMSCLSAAESITTGGSQPLTTPAAFLQRRAAGSTSVLNSVTDTEGVALQT
jgi:hypothetical protein